MAPPKHSFSDSLINKAESTQKHTQYLESIMLYSELIIDDQCSLGSVGKN